MKVVMTFFYLRAEDLKARKGLLLRTIEEVETTANQKSLRRV